MPVEPAPEPDPTPPLDATLLELERFVGLPIDDFIDQVEPLGYNVRIAEQDGEGLDLTADFSETRLNVAVDSGIVTSILNLG